MLTLESLNATKDLVAILADKGVTLRPVGGSPLAEAMAATKVWGTNIDCLSRIDSLPGDLYQSNETVIVGGEVREDLHTSYVEAASKALGVALAGHVAHATSVVLPLISQLHDEIKNSQDLETRCGVRSFKLEMVTGSALLDVAEIVAAIDKHASLEPVRELPFVLDFKPLGDEDLVKLMKIGAETYDAAVDQFVAQNGIELIREVWNIVFAHETGKYENYDVFRSDRVKGTARNFAVFLFTTKLLADSNSYPETEGTSGLSSSRYVMALKSLQEVAGTALYVTLMYQRNNEKQGKLIDKVDNKVVYVNKAVYDRFMADGGDIETILGSVVSGNKKVYVSEINAEATEFKQTWAYHVTQDKLNAATNELIEVRRVINSFVRAHLRQSEDPIIKTNQERILTNLDLFLSRIYTKSLENIDVLAMNVLCEVVYNHTDALSILTGINEAMSINPDISKEDALNMSLTNYVSNWFASQIEIDA